MPKVRFILGDDSQHIYEMDQQTFRIGRSDECEIIIKDPHVSRFQAQVCLEDEGYFIENLGRNPTQVNGRPIQSQFLRSGDEITLGQTHVLFEIEEREEEVLEEASFEEKTVALTSPVETGLSPRLVLTTESGESIVYPLEKDQFQIGRSMVADLNLDDASVSRKHCIVEKQDDGFWARNLSETNPLLVNDEFVSEKRLYRGDQLRIGVFVLAFISDRAADVQPVEESVGPLEKGPGWPLWGAAACLLLILGIYVFYWHAYRPWKLRRVLESVSEQITAGEHLPAQDVLKRLLASHLPPEEAQKAQALLSQTALVITQSMIDVGELQEAKRYLVAYLKDHGAGKGAESLWERLGFIYLKLGQEYESFEKYQMALREYAAITDESPYFDAAQKGIRGIWLAYQQQRRQHQTMAQLLKEAETHFRARRYLTPVNQNAYAVYQAVLAIDPQHATALKRIEQMKTFYREHAEKYFEKRNWGRALSYLKRFSVIDPDNPEVKTKTAICRQKLSAAKSGVQESKGRKAAPDEKQDRVKRLLEESGAESTWIMKYLFEEQDRENASETPW